MKILHYSIITILFVFVLVNLEHVFADDDSTSHLNVTTDYGGRGIMVNSNQTMSPFLPSPPLGMYPYTSKIFSVFQIDPEIVHPGDISAIHILVTNNANFTLYDVNLGESLNDSKSVMFSDIHKIDILNPNQTKTIFGTLRVSSDVRPTDYYDVWWNIVAKNQTGHMMESMQFHRTLPIAQNLPRYCCDKPVTITLESPLKQFKSGVKAEDVTCDYDFILAINEHYSPACLKESSAEKLLLRGWVLGFAHYRAVYFVKPDSTSQISVQYEPLNFKDQTPSDLAMQLNSRIYKSNSSYPTNEINATARPDLIHTQLITIVNYTVTTSDTTGVYWLSLAYQCNLIPIAVGIDPLQMTLSDLQDPSTSISCSPSETQFHVSGISNATLKLIRVD